MTIYTLMPLHESLGLAVIGLDLSQPIDAENQARQPVLPGDIGAGGFGQSVNFINIFDAARAFGPVYQRQHYIRSTTASSSLISG